MRRLVQLSRPRVSVATLLVRVIAIVIAAAIATEAINVGLALLNAPSDVAVIGGVLVIATTAAAGFAVVRRFWQ